MIKLIIPYEKFKLGDILDMVDHTAEIWSVTNHSDKTQNILSWKEKTIEISYEIN